MNSVHSPMLRSSTMRMYSVAGWQDSKLGWQDLPNHELDKFFISQPSTVDCITRLVGWLDFHPFFIKVERQKFQDLKKFIKGVYKSYQSTTEYTGNVERLAIGYFTEFVILKPTTDW